MKERSTAYCISCDNDVEYSVSTERVEAVVRDVRISYIELSARCACCGEEIYVAEINDANVRAREDAYREAANLITVTEIEEIMTRYNIGAGPLAKVLGLGDVTINRYLLGQLPSKQISEKLFELKANRRLMRDSLEENKARITETAYTKCREALDHLDALLGISKIENVTRYLLCRCADITPLALQKLLYYAQAFFHALFGKDLFTDDCQAWAHGPVYPDIYYQYREYGYDPIAAPVDILSSEQESGLSAEETNFLDTIINVFGSYSGKTLSSFTHAEKPWLVSRGSLKPDDRCTNTIKRDLINSYFDAVVQRLDIGDPCDISKYCDAMLHRKAQ